ncbi:MAG: hypothetical protein MJE66_07605 [Proteobacteria bacterium]|nr:hypothetical protein [Pseudomonadota bacterium]
MAGVTAFEHVCGALEAAASLNQLEARGTIRLALKQAGLEARSVTPDQMAVVLERVLPAELESRGIESAESVCSEIRSGLSSLSVDTTADSPEDVFARLGGGE